jgi:hypothetical protein
MLNKLDTHTQRHRSPVLHLNYEAAVALQALHKVRQCYAPQSTFFVRALDTREVATNAPLVVERSLLLSYTTHLFSDSKLRLSCLSEK